MKNHVLLLVSMFFSVALRGQSVCSEAATATLGTNSVPATSDNFYWYTYTMPSDGKLQIASSNSNYLYVYAGSCENRSSLTSGYENATAALLNSGDQVLIRWETTSGGDFDWNLSVSASEAGDACSLAATATTGTNTIPTTTNTAYWYAYTMPSDGKLQIATSSYQYAEIYSNNCESLNYEKGAQGKITITTLSNGDEVFINWYLDNGGNFDWDLSVSPLEPGDDCSLATTPVLGTNTIPETSNSDYWYAYTMPSEGKLQISSITTDFVRVYSNTCDNLQHEGFGDKATITTLTSGDEVFLKWSTLAGGGNSDWNLSISPLEPGDNCSLAVTAVTGTNDLPQTTNDYYWYTYTMPSEGKLRISSSASQYVQVYSGSCDALQNEEDGYENVNVTSLNSGDQVYIKWDTRYESDFSWDLSVVPLETGDNCAFAANAVTGTNALPSTPNSTYWYVYTMPIDGKLTISSSSLASVNVYSNSCDDLVYLDGAYGNSDVSAQANSGDQVYIRWSTYNGGNFDWTLSTEALEPGEGCSSAVPVAMGTNTTSGAPYWFKYEVPVSGEYTLSSVGQTTEDTYLVVYSDCSNTLLGENDDTQGGFQSELSLSLTTGEIIYIHWDDAYSPAGFDWTLSSNAQYIAFESLPTKNVDDATFALNATASSGLPVSYSSSNHSVATVSGNTVTIVGVGTTTITASQAGDDNFPAAEPVSQALTVNKASQIITVDAIADQLIDASPLTVNAVASSGLALDYAVTGPATIDGNVVTVSGTEGTVRVTVSQTGDHYYQATSNSVSFQVTDPSLQDQTITFEPLPAKTVDDADFTLTASASSSLPITYRSSDERVATVSGNTVMIVGAGTTTLTAHQAGNSSYRAASVSQELTVTDPRQTTANCGDIAVIISDKSDNICSGSTDGSLTAVATGGQAPYRYSIDGINFQDSNRFDTLDSGTYVITVNDANACTATVDALITTPNVLSIVGQVDHSTESVGNGRIALEVSGGTAPYQYAWSTKATTATVDNLTLGEYSVTVTDARACVTTGSFTVEGVTATEDGKQRRVAVYPNPIRDVLRVEVSYASEISATLFDLSGKKVLTMNLVNGENRIDASALKSGSYLLKLEDGSTQRVVVR